MRNGRFRKRELLIIAAAAVSIALLVIYRKELMELAPASLDLDRADIAVETMQQMVASTEADAVPQLMERLWKTGRLPQRRFVAAYLREQGVNLTPHWAQVKPIVIEATLGPDAESIADALGLLWILRESQALMHARSMVHDADPRVRWEWVNYVGMMGNEQHTAILVPLLDDPSGSVAARAATAVAKWTNQLVDIRAEDSPERRRGGSERFRAWWEEHKSKFAAASAMAAAPRAEPSVQAYPFVLEDAGGQGVSLDGLSDRVVVLHFFTTRSPAAAAMLEALGELERSTGQRVHVVHVCTDRLEDVYAYDPMRRPLVSPGMSELGIDLPTGAGTSGFGAPLGATAAIDAVEHLAAQTRVSGPILIDATGETTAAYAATPQPTCVVIDRSGIVHRRFSGPRDVEALRAMVTAVDPLARPKDVPAEPRDPLDALPTPTLPPVNSDEPTEPDLPPLPPPPDAGDRPPIPGLPPPPRPRLPAPTPTPTPIPPDDATAPDTPPAAPARSR